MNSFDRGPQQDIAHTCSNENCSARCHQAYNGLSTGQTCHAKDSGHSIIWKCPQHGSGIAEVIIPPAPVYEQPNRPSAVGKSCSVCMNPICTRYADLAYHCADPSCDNVFILQPRAADSYTQEETLDHALFPPEFGTVISTQQLHQLLHHQQCHILHH